MIVYKCLHDVNHVFCSDLKEKKYAHVIINIYFLDNFSTKVSQPIANIPTKSFFYRSRLYLCILFCSWVDKVDSLYMFSICSVFTYYIRQRFLSFACTRLLRDEILFRSHFHTWLYTSCFESDLLLWYIGFITSVVGIGYDCNRKPMWQWYMRMFQL